MIQVDPIHNQLADIGQKATQIRQALAFLRTEAKEAGLNGLAEAIGDAILAAEGDRVGINRFNS